MLVKTFIGYDLEQVIQDSNIFVLALEKGQFVSTQFNPLLEGVTRTRDKTLSSEREHEEETMTNLYRYVAMVYYLDESELERKKEREHLSS